MASEKAVSFVDNSELEGDQAAFETVTVRVPTVLRSWKSSLFSFEWIKPDGSLKDIYELPHHLRERRLAVEEKLKSGQALEKPVLGIGLLETIEIGVGRDVFLTLAAHGVTEIPVHIPVNMAREFSSYRV